MKKITRNLAISVFHNLGAMALGHMDATTLEATMTNFESLRKVADDFEALKKELFKRIYGDVEKMEEDEKTKLQSFFDALSRIANAEDAEESEKALKAEFPTYYDMRMKEMKVILSLLNKEIDVDIVEMDKKAFVKGIMLGHKDILARDVEIAFAPLFKTEEKAETDMSELDELLNE